MLHIYIYIYDIRRLRVKTACRKSSFSQCRWPLGLRSRSAATWQLGSRVLILLSTWTFVSCVCCVCGVGSSLCDRMITHSEESYRVCAPKCACDLETEWLGLRYARVGLLGHRRIGHPSTHRNIPFLNHARHRNFYCSYNWKPPVGKTRCQNATRWQNNPNNTEVQKKVSTTEIQVVFKKNRSDVSSTTRHK